MSRRRRQGRAREGETILPPDEGPVEQGLGSVRGSLSHDHPFLAQVDEIVTARVRHRPRTLYKRRTSKQR
jgi:hypothetical protein